MIAFTLALALGISGVTSAAGKAESSPDAAPGNPAATAPREQPPRPGPPPVFRLPEKRDFTLPNGLAVTLARVGSLPRATVQLAVRIGSGDESAGETGLARFVAEMLVEGTKTRTAEEIAAQAARFGGSVAASVTADETVVGGTVLSEFTPEFVALVADVAANPAFPPKALERVRQDAIRQVTIARSVPQTLAQEQFLALTYPGHGYGRLLATPEQLRGYGAEEVRAFHAAVFAAGRAHLYVAGRFDPVTAEQAIRSAFGAFPAGAPRELRPPTPASRRAVNLVDRPGAVQSSIYVGLPALDPRSPDYLPLVVTNTILGGYFSSRMTANLREAKGYTYSPYSMLAVRAGGPGFWAQVADVTTGVTGASLKEIFLEIDRLRSEPPSAKEVDAAQAYLAGQFLLQTSRREGLIERLRFVNLNRLPETWLAGYVQGIRAVTPAQVQEAARRWLDGARMTVVVVGDRKEIEPQVKPYGELVLAPPRS
jgi:predicted Zn-dependent peptidase